MKKGSMILIAVLAVVVVIVIALVGGYNSMVNAQTDVEQKQADIQTQLQRRADLIPNFVATVKGYSDYEQSTLQAVTEARAAGPRRPRAWRRPTSSWTRPSACGSTR